MTAEVWMGYLIDHHDEFTVVQSPFVLDGQRVFGADSDATTLAVAQFFIDFNTMPSIRYRFQKAWTARVCPAQRVWCFTNLKPRIPSWRS